ncbi:MAG TPA: 16S rRNA (adenine(1518)-N(6)/adenine(1519)-N(6))-dimethyltransferase RsmA [Candidatus Binataceae bacterium]|nr:16S rRNA (adenine(1518)-N(6)/adenine(1519)-N(6))-dimethyltransferase RsmA [Candidatus Binataceae bacterium]
MSAAGEHGLTATNSTALAPSAALALAGVRPRKSRGQNFLVQRAVADRIVAAAALARDDAVVEIGPGLGMLTDAIARAPIRALALIELDERLAAMLRTRFAGDRRIAVINRDFMTLRRDDLGPPPIKVLGNLPFNVAAAILQRLCEFRGAIGLAVLMFQREVAERIRACPGSREHGALSVFTAIYWRVREHFRVAAGNFHPRPKVDAEVLVLEPRADLIFDASEEAAVLRTIRAGFSAPRKTLRNSLAGGFAIEAAALQTTIESAGLAPGARPATLSAADFVRLARALVSAGLLEVDGDA